MFNELDICSLAATITLILPNIAAFFAITLMEEVGKIPMLAGEKFGGKFDGKSFHNHNQKYAYAVAYTLLINSRFTEVYGELEERFAKWFREGDLFRIRNNALYLNRTGSRTYVPKEVITAEEACLLVCVAGEIYANIQDGMTGTGSQEWERIIAEVDAFREESKKRSLTL